jgi:hypothetical protein
MAPLSAAAARFGKIPHLLLLGLGPGLLLGAVLATGQYTRTHIRGWDRYQIRFADIDCVPPPGQSREEFLAEVQYAAGMPDRIAVLDDHVGPALAAAFTHHPWVEGVDEVSLLSPRHIKVRLVYRTPVLTIPVVGKSDGLVSGWSLDSRGVRLPPSPGREGLPLLCSRPLPAGPSGKPCGDAALEGAARTVAFLHPHQDRLRLKQIEVTATGLVLHTGNGSRILWGRPIGAEEAGEATAAVKVERLLYFCQCKGHLATPGAVYEHDVRPQDRAIHQRLKF